jgi:UDP-N-acetylmuramoyl-L-alanyl-D-glutamate--2,6-diaminopimelate ligase
MGRVSGQLADFTVITAEDPRTEDLAEICREIERGVREFTDADRYTIVPDRTAAIQFAVDMARPGDVVASFGKGTSAACVSAKSNIRGATRMPCWRR